VRTRDAGPAEEHDGRNLTYDGLAACTVGFWEQTQRRRGWHPGPVDAEHRTQRSIAERSPSLRLPRLLGPVQRVLRVSTLLYRGVPRLEEHDLVQRRGFLVRRVHLRMAAFDVLPGRPGRVLLAAEHGHGRPGGVAAGLGHRGPQPYAR